MPTHLLEHSAYAAKGASVVADALLIADSADSNAVKQLAISALSLPAANSSVAAIPNLTAGDVQAALAELQGDIDNLNSMGAANYYAMATDPGAGDYADGDYVVNVVSGDVFGPKAGTWPPSTTNVYSQLGLSAVAPQPAGVAAVGTAGTAARADHVHAAQTAAQVPVAGITNLTAADVQAALAEHQSDIDALQAAGASDLATVTGVGNTTATDIEITDPTKGVILRNGAARWRLTVNAAGALVTAAA